MKTRLQAVIALLMIISMVSGPSQIGAPKVQAREQSPEPGVASTLADKARVAAALQSSPVMFIENVGQFDAGARFQVRGSDRTMWLADDGIWVTLLERPAADAALKPGSHADRFPGLQAGDGSGDGHLPSLSLSEKGEGRERVRPAAPST